MKRSMKNVCAVAGATALLALAAPPAMAAPGDAAGCTTDYVSTVGGPYIIPWPLATVTYTPPARVDVDASPAVNFTFAVARHVANATIVYVDCIR